VIAVSYTQKHESAVVTHDDIVAGLHQLGLPAGSSVLVHSSLKSFGYVDGGAPTVVRALLTVLGPKGTLLVPTFPFRGTQYSYLKSNPVFDVRNTPSLVGVITETVRQWPSARRSLHPDHPVAAIGALAEDMLAHHERIPTCCGLGSPFMRNVFNDGYILLLGVDNRRNTTLHAVEEAEDPDIFSSDTFIPTVIDWHGRSLTVPVRAYAENRSRNFPVVEEPLKAAGIMRMGRIGDAAVRLIAAQPMYKLVSEMLCHNRRALLADTAS
jgi:aminoglycoside 3-N-acetyltransferase